MTNEQLQMQAVLQSYNLQLAPKWRKAWQELRSQLRLERRFHLNAYERAIVRTGRYIVHHLDCDHIFIGKDNSQPICDTCGRRFDEPQPMIMQTFAYMSNGVKYRVTRRRCLPLRYRYPATENIHHVSRSERYASAMKLAQRMYGPAVARVEISLRQRQKNPRYVINAECTRARIALRHNQHQEDYVECVVNSLETLLLETYGYGDLE